MFLAGGCPSHYPLRTFLVLGSSVSAIVSYHVSYHGYGFYGFRVDGLFLIDSSVPKCPTRTTLHIARPTQLFICTICRTPPTRHPLNWLDGT